MSVTENYNLPLPDPVAASAKADVQKIREALIALDEALVDLNIDAYTKDETNTAISQAKGEVKAQTKAELRGGASADHDTLQKLAALLGDNDDAVAALTDLVGQKADLSELTGNLVPIGAIIDFPIDAVPLGYLPCLGATYDPLVYPGLYEYLGTNVLPKHLDRVRRGPGPLAGNVGDTQEDAFQEHEHEAGFSANTNPGRYGLGPDGQDGTYLDLDASNPGTFTTGGALTSTVGGSETRVKSVITLPCIKAYSAFTSQGTADLAAMEQAINNAVLASGVQVFSDGGAQVRENIGAEVNLGELHLQDRKGQGVVGGPSSGGTWNVRDLNTELVNTLSGSSLLNDKFTLPIGEFKLKAKSSVYSTSRAKLQVYNVTDGVYENINSPNDYCHASYGGHSVVQCEGTLVVTGSPKEYELRMYVETSKSINGLGIEYNLAGFDEIYSDVFIRKVS